MVGMTLTDAQLADLTRQAADQVEPGLEVSIAPAANDDPYRWGPSGWLVTVGSDVHVWVPADASPDWVLEEVTHRLKAERGSSGA
jgi:hypothetical protein